MIGAALMAGLQRAGVPVFGTTRRRGTLNKTRIYLDLAEGATCRRWPDSLGAAVICAGVTKLDACRQDPAGTSRVNIETPVALSRDLVAQGSFVIFISSSQVFDGSRPAPKPADPPAPLTIYGHQKAEAERQILAAGDNVSVVRLTKVLGPENAFFSRWRDALRGVETIQAFTDMYFAPLPLGYVVSVLQLVIARRMPGILQVSAERDVSYADAARLGARALGVDQGRVQGVSMCEVRFAGEKVQRHTTMDFQRLQTTLGIRPPPVEWTVEQVFTHPERLAGSE